MRFLITGANGQVGWELAHGLRSAGEVIALDRAHCDLADPEGLRTLVRESRPDVIVNAAAYTAVDQAEQEEPLATVVNGIAPGVLAEEARSLGALLVHYSTDYVFDGTKTGAYTEDDPTCPINAYGRSKLAGEQAIRQAAGNYLILRTSWVYAARRKNFLLTVLRLARERPELRIVSDQIGAPTWARSIADATQSLVKAAQQRRSRGGFSSGLYHLTAAGAVSWHGFAEAIITQAHQRGLLHTANPPAVLPISTEAYSTSAARPRNSRLGNNKLYADYGIVLPGWQMGMTDCINEIAERPL